MDEFIQGRLAVLAAPAISDNAYAAPKSVATKRLNVALVHDYLVQDGGAERVLAALQDMFPTAPTYVLVHDKTRAHPQFLKRKIHTSYLNKLPAAQRHYQWYMPLMAMGVEHLDISGFDLVISSSSSFAKGVILPPETRHICYCHTPTRFLWQDRISYVNDLPQPRLLRTLLTPILHRLRTWDTLAAARPDYIVTNSLTSQNRIRRYYQREASVIYPPVDVDRVPLSQIAGSFWLAGGRLVAYKRFDLIVQAFAKLDMPLKIFGVGPEEKKLRALAGRKTEFWGHVDDETKIKLYTHAIGFINPQIEDFGITAIEAMAAGKPVIAFGQGGASETIIDGVTGVYIEAQTWADIGDAVIRFQPERFDAPTIRRQAEKFSTLRFQTEILSFIEGVR